MVHQIDLCTEYEHSSASFYDNQLVTFQASTVHGFVGTP
jgi:hypothetical protein